MLFCEGILPFFPIVRVYERDARCGLKLHTYRIVTYERRDTKKMGDWRKKLLKKVVSNAKVCFLGVLLGCVNGDYNTDIQSVNVNGCTFCGFFTKTSLYACV